MRVEAGGGVDRVEDRQALALADLAVDLAERGSEVHDARPVVDRHEVGGDDPPRVAGGVARRREEVERALVVEADEVGGRDRSDDLGVVAEHGVDAGGGDDEVAPVASDADPDVLDVGADRDRRRWRSASTGWSSTRGGRSRVPSTGKRT